MCYSGDSIPQRKVKVLITILFGCDAVGLLGLGLIYLYGLGVFNYDTQPVYSAVLEDPETQTILLVIFFMLTVLITFDLYMNMYGLVGVSANDRIKRTQWLIYCWIISGLLGPLAVYSIVMIIWGAEHVRSIWIGVLISTTVLLGIRLVGIHFIRQLIRGPSISANSRQNDIEDVEPLIP